MSTATKLEKTDLRIYASGSGALSIVVNCPKAEVTAETIAAYVAEFDPHLSGWLVKNMCPRYERSSWVLVHPFANLTGDLAEYPMVVRDELTGNAYKVLVNAHYVRGAELRHFNCDLIGVTDGREYEVKNVSLLAAFFFYANNKDFLKL